MPNPHTTDTDALQRAHQVPSRHGSMNRRAYLAALSGTVAAVAGCSSRDPPAPEPTPEPTPPPDVETVTPLDEPGTPDDVSSRSAAREFVARHERRLVHEELRSGFGGAQPPVAIDVERPQVAVVHETDRGYYLLSTCSGSADYHDPDGSARGATRNAASVAHFVGDVHRRIPFNGYRCRRPVATTTPRSDVPAARFQIYDFETPPDDDTDAGGHEVAVTVSDESTVLDETYRTSLPLTVQPGVTASSGRYALEASLADGGRVEHDWDLSDADAPAWWALAVLVTHGGELTTLTLYPNEAVGLPRGTLCGQV
ncbi:hypothetical protein [Halorarius halobius]|uniref:hypothetical protein n=1 Tax=Halorarius halobius TaxID=2962671 RepID=UPI0020CF8C99|nr:hypothetical protein [Halorarius halobius]